LNYRNCKIKDANKHYPGGPSRWGVLVLLLKCRLFTIPYKLLSIDIRTNSTNIHTTKQFHLHAALPNPAETTCIAYNVLSHLYPTCLPARADRCISNTFTPRSYSCEGRRSLRPGLPGRRAKIGALGLSVIRENEPNNILPKTKPKARWEVKLIPMQLGPKYSKEL
jgi:hypothetical protein